MEDVSKAVVGDVPPLRERGHDRALRPCFDEPVEQLHAQLDVRPGDRRFRVGVVRQEARGDAKPLGRGGGALLRRPLVERALVHGVRLGEPQRRVQRERELEEHERAGLPLAPPLEERQQGAVVPDRLVERILLPGLVAGAQQVLHRFLLVLCGEPVVREQPQHLALAARVALFQPLRRSPVQLRPSGATQGPVRGLLDQRMMEAALRLRPPAALLDEPEPLQLVERFARVAVLEDAVEQRQREAAPERRGSGDHVMRLGRQPVETCENHLLDGQRNLDLGVVVESPPRGARHERACVDQ